MEFFSRNSLPTWLGNELGVLLTEQISSFSENIHYQHPALLLAFSKSSLMEDIAVTLIYPVSFFSSRVIHCRCW
jgi:hypothetical protein